MPEMYPNPPAGGGKRSRIVINVDDPKQKAARARGAGRIGRLGRGGKVLSVVALVLIGLLLLTLVGGYVWWQSYRKSPGYSLALLVDAAQRDDSQTVEKMIDSDRVAQSLAPQVVNKALSSVGGMGALAAPRRQIEAALPVLLPGMREQVRAEIARGVKEVAARSGGGLPFPLLALAVPRMCESIKEDGDGATVLFKQGERPVELDLQRDGERWKVVGIKDEELAANIATRVVGGMNVPGANRR